MYFSMPAHVVEDKEEQSLFREVAEDIAFALHAIEVEETRKRAEGALLKQQYFFSESPGDWHYWHVGTGHQEE